MNNLNDKINDQTFFSTGDINKNKNSPVHYLNELELRTDDVSNDALNNSLYAREYNFTHSIYSEQIGG